MSIRTRAALISLLLLFLACPAQAADEAGPRPERPTLRQDSIEPFLRTDWYGVYLSGKKIGYFRTARERNAGTRSEGTIREVEDMHLKLASFGQKSDVTITQTSIFEGQAPYRLMRAEMVQRTPREKYTLVRNPGGFEYTLENDAEKSTKMIGDIDYDLADALAADLWIQRGPAAGTKATFKQFDVKDAKTYTIASKVLGAKSSLAGGVKVRYFEVENVSAKDMLTYLTRHDDQGRMLSNVIAIFELRLEPEDQAKSIEYSQDLFVLGMVKCDRKLGSTKRVTELVLDVSGKEGAFFENGPRQSVAPSPDGGRLLKLGKSHGKEVRATAKEIAECLEETNAYRINHPRVKALADKAVAGASTPEEKVRRIVDFVNGFVSPSMSAAMPSIHDLLDKQRGDCKSYALLVTNLARAAGIPAREVSGLLYIGDDQKAFGGHAWNEVVLGGVWVPVDASLRQTEVDATHVSFGTDTKAAKNLLTSLGKLSFKVIEVKSAP